MKNRSDDFRKKLNNLKLEYFGEPVGKVERGHLLIFGFVILTERHQDKIITNLRNHCSAGDTAAKKTKISEDEEDSDH